MRKCNIIINKKNRYEICLLKLVVSVQRHFPKGYWELNSHLQINKTTTCLVHYVNVSNKFCVTYLIGIFLFFFFLIGSDKNIKLNEEKDIRSKNGSSPNISTSYCIKEVHTVHIPRTIIQKHTHARTTYYPPSSIRWSITISFFLSNSCAPCVRYAYPAHAMRLLRHALAFVVRVDASFYAWFQFLDDWFYAGCY